MLEHETMARNLLARALKSTRAAAQLRLDELGDCKAAAVAAIKAIGDSADDVEAQDGGIRAALKTARDRAEGAPTETPPPPPPVDDQLEDAGGVDADAPPAA